jgi:hypothetical protein
VHLLVIYPPKVRLPHSSTAQGRFKPLPQGRVAGNLNLLERAQGQEPYDRQARFDGSLALHQLRFLRQQIETKGAIPDVNAGAPRGIPLQASGEPAAVPSC